ncbi:MAG: FkbM family methyltransferase [Rhodospirillaceae bacterium]
MTWQPPENFEEKLKRLFVPPDLYIRRLSRREMRKGEREYPLVPFLVRRDRIALDVGANKGVYAALLAEHCLGVHAFEPNPKLFGILSRWAKPPKVIAHQIALSDQTGTAELMVPKSAHGYSNQGASLSKAKLDGQEYGGVSVETKRLDDLDLPPIGFMKIDVEGFECQMLRGAAETLRRDRPTLLVEVEERHNKRRLEDSLGEIAAYGYDCFALINGALTALANVDLDISHRKAGGDREYVNNFIFIAKDMAS